KNVRKRRPITLQHPEAKFLLYNTRRFRFGLPSPDHALGLPVGNYVNLLAKMDGVLVVRAYTPVSTDEDLGFVDLTIKVNDARHVQLPHQGGKMTQYLENMKTGDTSFFKGHPDIRSILCVFQGSLRSTYETSELENKLVHHLGMIAGGTGKRETRPACQLCSRGYAPAAAPSGKTRMSLVRANQTQEEILVRKELEEVDRTHAKQFNLWYTLDRPPVGKVPVSGFITEDTIKEHLPPPGRFSFILVCGPPPLIQRAVHPNLEKLGYTRDMIFTY
uniref:cytochrome-b5 reductase n=1 Tax=Phocoena sinus TaxID=42100 RepID=A0A8C9C770_PHOSS